MSAAAPTPIEKASAKTSIEATLNSKYTYDKTITFREAFAKVGVDGETLINLTQGEKESVPDFPKISEIQPVAVIKLPDNLTPRTSNYPVALRLRIRRTRIPFTRFLIGRR
jgi:hypothetical protein